VKYETSIPAGLCVLLFALLSIVAGAAPVGMVATLETGATDMLEVEDELQMYIQPELVYALGATGLTAGLAWEIPFYPQTEVGTLEGRIEFQTVLPGLVLTAGNETAVVLEDWEVEGLMYVVGGHSMGDFSVEMELDFGYLPVVALDTIVGLGYEREVGPGLLAVSIEQNIGLYDQLEAGDTELPVSYELVAGGFVITLEVEPILTADREFTLGALVRLERFF
jgi:hypothetical protein